MFHPDMMRSTLVPFGYQAQFDFGKYILSVVQNDMSYGAKKGLYEISVFKGDDQVELPGITNEGDTVRGFLTQDDVNIIIKKLTTITGVDAKLI